MTYQQLPHSPNGHGTAQEPVPSRGGFLASLRRSPAALSLVVGSFGLVVAGALGLGWTAQVHAANANYTELEDRWMAAQDELAQYRDDGLDRQTDADSAAESQAKVDAKQHELDERLAAVKDKEAALDAAKEQVIAAQLSDGVHVVGKDTAPGVYAITDSVDCYYEWKSGTGADASIIDNNLVSGAVTVTLKDSEVFEARNCGAWKKVG